MVIRPIGFIHTDFPEKFGIPRQSGLIDELTAEIIFLPEYRNPDAFHGLEGFSHIWLLWEFSANDTSETRTFHASVHPPRLGSNEHRGVFATRSPFRPNPVGLSCVRLLQIRKSGPDGITLLVSGADLMDGTPIFDIKPYIPYTDCRPEAAEGFTEQTRQYRLEVVFPEELLAGIPEEKQKALIKVLEEDPRPNYQNKDPERVYGFYFAGMEIHFCVKDGVLTVKNVNTSMTAQR